MEVCLFMDHWLAEFRILDAGRQDIVQRDTSNDVPVGPIAFVAALAAVVGKIWKFTIIEISIGTRNTASNIVAEVLLRRSYE